MKKISFAMLAMLVGTPFLASAQVIAPAQAASAPTPTADTCPISSTDLAAIQKVQQDPTLSASEELTQELTLRKQLLIKTITCAVDDAQTLQQTLNSITPVNGSGAIQDQLSSQLNDTLNFYANESGKIANAGISGTQAVAKELLSWRASKYDPLQAQVDNFLLWTENQNIFQTAENRLFQTQQIVSFIESATSNADLQAKFSNAQTSLQAAQTQNNDARNALAQSLSPDQSLALIQGSLKSLADSYQKFSDLNSLIQTLLPTSSQ